MVKWQVYKVQVLSETAYVSREQAKGYTHQG